jgi:hypothetical protein
MSKTIEDLRAALFATLEGVKSGAIEIERARAVNEVAKTIVDTARVEVQFFDVVGGKNAKSAFLLPGQACHTGDATPPKAPAPALMGSAPLSIVAQQQRSGA